MTVLCLVEQDAGGIADASLRMLTAARGLAAPAGADGGDPGDPGRGARGGAVADAALAAVFFGPAGQVDRETLASYGVRAAYVIEPERLPGYAPLAWARVLAGLIGVSGAHGVAAAATGRGNEVMAHLGAITGLPMAANCVSAEPDGAGRFRLVRHRWGGLLLEDAVLESAVALLTVAAEAVAPRPLPEPVPVDIRLHQPGLDEADLRVRAAESAAQSGGASLATARVVVGGGRGVGGPEGFAALEELAGLLGGAIGVSRVVTSEGWRPHAQQVGQTGTRITPDLYLACGISGAIQHMAGCSGAKNIVAINTDPGAPMMSHADYAVVGDLHEIVPALAAAIRARRSG